MDLKEKRSCSRKTGDSLQKFDLLGETFKLKIDEKGKKSQTSVFGAFVSIFLYVIIIIFTVQQIILLIEKKKISLVASPHEYFYSESSIFDSDLGFKVAVALTGYDNTEEY